MTDLTPAERAGLQAEADAYEARQHRLRTERDAKRHEREHEAWRARCAAAASPAVGLRLGDEARRLLIGGQWHDGRFTLTSNNEVAGDDLMWWVDCWTRSVIPHSVVQGWQITDPEGGDRDRFTELRNLRINEPQPDCAGSGQGAYADAAGLADDDVPAEIGTTRYCFDCEQDVPVVANDVGGAVYAAHDVKGRPLPAG